VRSSCQRPNRSSGGFTLIELLVVVTIVSILVGAVVINIEFRNPGKMIRDNAFRVGLQMELASDQAVYSRQQFGIRFHPESYEFYILNQSDGGDALWEIFEDKQLSFKDSDIDTDYEVDISGLPIVLEELDVELAEATEEDPMKPHIIFLSNGEIMPDFRIRIADRDGEYRYEVATGDLEPIVVEQLDGS